MEREREAGEREAQDRERLERERLEKESLEIRREVTLVRYRFWYKQSLRAQRREDVQ